MKCSDLEIISISVETIRSYVFPLPVSSSKVFQIFLFLPAPLHLRSYTSQFLLVPTPLPHRYCSWFAHGIQVSILLSKYWVLLHQICKARGLGLKIQPYFRIIIDVWDINMQNKTYTYGNVSLLSHLHRYNDLYNLSKKGENNGNLKCSPKRHQIKILIQTICILFRLHIKDGPYSFCLWIAKHASKFSCNFQCRCKWILKDI